MINSELLEEDIVRMSKQAIPELPFEEYRGASFHPSMNNPGTYNFGFIIVVSKVRYYASGEISAYKLHYSNDYSGFYEQVEAVYDKMRDQLKADGLLAFEKKPDPAPLPDWMVKP